MGYLFDRTKRKTFANSQGDGKHRYIFPMIVIGGVTMIIEGIMDVQ